MALQLLTTDPDHPEQLTDWRPGTCTHPDPDLDAVATVAWHRDWLKNRNRAVPVYPSCGLGQTRPIPTSKQLRSCNSGAKVASNCPNQCCYSPDPSRPT